MLEKTTEWLYNYLKSWQWNWSIAEKDDGIIDWTIDWSIDAREDDWMTEQMLEKLTT